MSEQNNLKELISQADLRIRIKEIAKEISLDYAFLNEPLSSGLGSTHLVSISISPNLLLKFIDKI